MGDIFRVILQMSMTASAVILAVALLRLLLVRAPRKYSYVLWLIVLVRLVCPLCLRTNLSVIPDASEWFAGSRGQQTGDGEAAGMNADDAGERRDGSGAPQIYDAEAAYISGAPSGALPAPEDVKYEEQADSVWNAERESADAGQQARITAKKGGVWLTRRLHVAAPVWNAIAWCWFAGAVLSMVCAGAGYVILIRRLKKYEVQTLREIGVGRMGRLRAKAVTKIRVRERMRLIEAKEIGSPFTVGILKPTICLPAGLPDMQREMVIAHEHTHIRRNDHLIKILAVAVCCIHWFNPLVWIAFLLFERDMETSCDEAAVQSLGYERRKDYAKTLLSLSGRRSGVPGLYPVSFGEKNTKARIRNVLALKKTGRRAALICAAAVAVAAVLLLTSRRPVQASGESDMSANESGTAVAGAEADGGSVRGDGEDMPSGSEPGTDGRADTGTGSTEDASGTESAGSEKSSAELAAVLDKIMTRVSEMIQSGELAEGDTRIEESEHYGLYEVIPVEDTQQTAADGSGMGGVEVLTAGSAILCNPQIGTDAEIREGKDVIILYAYPLAAEDGKMPLMSATYCSREHPVTGDVMFHSGCDFAAKAGTPVCAAADGVVYRTGYMGQAGNCVILIHANGDVTYYAHCETILDSIVPGTIVSCGQQIATVGNTGASTGPHLHFAVSRDGAYIEPKFASMNKE